MEVSFAGRVALVTGAGRGLGRSHALLLAARGASVVVNDLGTDTYGSGQSPVAYEVVAEIEAHGGRAFASYADVATETGGAAAVQTALDAFGTLDVLVHNAGILQNRPFQDDPEHVRRVVDVHLLGAWHVGRPAFSHMAETGYGRIVLTGSAAAFGLQGQTAYAAAKLGVVGLTRTLQLEADALGINVKSNVIVPMALTRMSSPQALDRWHGLNDPAEVAAVVAYLSSDMCQIGGEALLAGGTHVARLILGHTSGWAKRGTGMTPEEVADHLGEILDPTNVVQPADTIAYVEEVFRLVDPTSTE